VCGHHAAPRTLVGNVFRQGFYWPTAVADANEVIRTCEGCQFYARKTNLPAHALQTIPVTWLFVVWGLDIVGPLSKAPRGYTHMLVAVDKFSNWIEARQITNLRAEKAVSFFTDITHRFGVSNSIITNNGSKFTGNIFCDYLFDHNLSLRIDCQFKEDRKMVPTLKISSISPNEKYFWCLPYLYHLFARGRANV
jgi:hypothetical protein